MRITVLLLFLCLLILNGCTTSAYFTDRGRDAADIFTAQVGYGGGAKVRAGPLQAGLLLDIGLGGLRGGDLLGKTDFWPSDADMPVKQEYLLGIFGIEAFGGSQLCDMRGKSFASKQIILSLPINFREDPELTEEAEQWKMVYNPWPYYTQLEIVVGLGLNARIGFNPGELIDFILGWTTLDIFNDDLEKKKRERLYN
jgi:hypothetical protein